MADKTVQPIDPEALRATIDGLTIMDDPYMQVFVQKDRERGFPVLTIMLRAFLEDPKLEIEWAQEQRPIENIGGRKITVDVLIGLKDGRIVNLEFQNETERVLLGKRAHLHDALATKTHTKAGTTFRQVPDVRVVFVTKEDFAKRGKPAYYYELRARDDPSDVLPGSPVYAFVNGEYNDTTSVLGQIIHDVQEPDPDKMLVAEIEDLSRELKKTKEGREMVSESLATFAQDYMADVIEEEKTARRQAEKEKRQAEERAAAERYESIRSMLLDGTPAEKIMTWMSATRQEIEAIQQDMTDQTGSKPN